MARSHTLFAYMYADLSKKFRVCILLPWYTYKLHDIAHIGDSGQRGTHYDMELQLLRDCSKKTEAQAVKAIDEHCTFKAWLRRQRRTIYLRHGAPASPWLLQEDQTSSCEGHWWILHLQAWLLSPLHSVRSARDSTAPLSVHLSLGKCRPTKSQCTHTAECTRGRTFWCTLRRFFQVDRLQFSEQYHQRCHYVIREVERLTSDPFLHHRQQWWLLPYLSMPRCNKCPPQHSGIQRRSLWCRSQASSVEIPSLLCFSSLIRSIWQILTFPQQCTCLQ